MATLTDLANGALQHIYVLEGGETAAAEDFAVSMKTLRQVLARLPEYGGGQKLVDVSTQISTEAVSDQRIICQGTGLVITLPEDPEDGARVAVSLLTGTADVKSTDRKLQGATATVTISADTTWIYRAPSIDWVAVTALSDTAASPYGDDSDSAIELITAMELAPKFSAQIGPELADSISEAKVFLRSKYNRPPEQNWRKSLPYSLQGPARLRSYR
ncbi:MAG: hypothetical protein AAFO74_13020 [Pseudomonadota bacterium]